MSMEKEKTGVKSRHGIEIKSIGVSSWLST